MNPKKNVALRLFSLLVLVIIVASGCGGSYMSPERALRTFSNRIRQNNINDLTLTIYFKDARELVLFPFSVEDLVGRGWYHYKIVVEGNELDEHKELLLQLSADYLIPFTSSYPMHATLYYVFEANGRTIFSFVPQASGDDSSMYINGVEFKWNDVFFDVIRPFLPEDVVTRWDRALMPSDW